MGLDFRAFQTRAVEQVADPTGTTARAARRRVSHRPAARRPPLWDLPDAGTGDFDPHAQPAPEYAFDQRLTW